jgi:hypothetical protein
LRKRKTLQGYAIEGKATGHFLDRTATHFRPVDEKNTPFIHGVEVIIAGGKWEPNADLVYAGDYDESTRLSKIIGGGETLEGLRAALKA